jgi:hypothetical protein
MQINPKEILFDQPILKIRGVVQYAMKDKLWGNSKIEITEKVAHILQTQQSIALYVIEQMIVENYLVFEYEKVENVEIYKLKTTDLGWRFGTTRANPPITRQKANQLLNKLIERAKTINADDELVYFVETLKVFGSYLSDKEILGDLDVSFKLSRKFGDNFIEKNQRRIDLAIANGKQFRNYMDELYWPYWEVMQILKTRQKGLSLHDEENDEVIKLTENRLVYEFRNE